MNKRTLLFLPCLALVLAAGLYTIRKAASAAPPPPTAASVSKFASIFENAIPEGEASSLYDLIAFRLSPDQAKAAYADLTPAQRREVWRYKWLSIKSDRLTAAQNAALKTAIDSLDQLHFDGKESTESLAAAHSAASEVLRQFDKKSGLATTLFSSLGNIAVIEAKQASMFASCSCFINNDFCWGAPVCIGGGCTPRSIGCGIGWVQPCDGECQTPSKSGN